MFEGWAERTKDTKGFLIWTGQIAAVSAFATWAAFKFVFDDSKISSFEAKVQASEAKASQYSAKVDVLEKEILNLRSENQLFRGWLESEPKSFPALTKTLIEQKNEINRIKESCKKDAGISPPPSENISYSKTAELKKGEAFVDPHTKIVFGVTDISVDSEVSGTITLPDGKTQKIDKIRPGKVWDYSKGSKDYQLILKRADWINNGIVVENVEKNK